MEAQLHGSMDTWMNDWWTRISFILPPVHGHELQSLPSHLRRSFGDTLKYSTAPQPLSNRILTAGLSCHTPCNVTFFFTLWTRFAYKIFKTPSVHCAQLSLANQGQRSIWCVTSRNVNMRHPTANPKSSLSFVHNVIIGEKWYQQEGQICTASIKIRQIIQPRANAHVAP